MGTNGLIEIRQEYWVQSGRSFIRSGLHKCFILSHITIEKYNYRKVSPRLPNLRLNDNTRPFYATGIYNFRSFYLNYINLIVITSPVFEMRFSAFPSG